MKNKIYKIILFVFTSFCLFAGNLEEINYANSKLIFKLKSVNKDDIQVNYDDDTRLVFIEIQKSNINIDNNKLLKFTENMCTTSYVNNMSVEDGDNCTLIYLTLKPAVAHNIKKSNNLITIDFKENALRPLIVIDPGHGGKDPGAVRKNVREKDIVIKVSKYLRDYLANDFDVIMTRDDDYFITLKERPSIGNRKNAKLFVSVHANAHRSSKANGVEVFYFSKKTDPYAERITSFENSFGDKFGENLGDIAQISGELAYKKNQEKSIVLAKDIAHNISENVNLRNGGVHGANFAVLRGFDGPSVLVELGFISNSYDVGLLTNNSVQKQMALEIANSIRRYFE